MTTADRERGASVPRLLLEGRPGVGKSTVARRLAERCQRAGVAVHGFTTDEVRSAGRREGFLMVPLDGAEPEVLAHVDLPGPPRVGRYGVDLAALERVALPTFHPPPADGVVIVDELGTMELASAALRDAVEAVLAAEVPVVATVHVRRDAFTDALRRRHDVEVLAVTHANRDALPDELGARLTEGREP